MKQTILKTLALGLMAMAGTNAWAGDFIDDATTISLTHSGGSKSTVTPNDGEKKTLSFTPTTTSDAIFEFEFTSKSVTPGQIFGVIEYTGNVQTGSNKCRFRNLTLDGNALEEGTAGSAASYTAGSKKVMLCNFLQNDNGTAAKVLKTFYKTNVDNASFALTYAKVYVGISAAGSEISINRVGVYTLGEILELYPELKTNNWQINDSYRLLNDASSLGINNNKTNNGTDNGLIETKNAAITTMAGCKLWLKAVDLVKIPDNYRYFWCRFLQPSDEATREDLFAGMNENAVLMLSFGTGSNPHVMSYLPTMHRKLIDFDRGMQNYTFVDGIAPASIDMVDGKTLGKSTTANWATYSRQLKAGYNSCMMPFKKITSASDVPDGISFYKVGDYSGGVITFTKIDDPTVSNTFSNGSDAWTPVIIKAETAGVYTFVGRDGIADLSGYKAKKVGNSGTDPNAIYWVGSYCEEAPMATGNDYESYTACYGISTDGSKFAKMKSDTKTTYYRAFLADNSGAGAPDLLLSFEDGNGTTAIEAIAKSQEPTANGQYYNLQGVRMTADQLPKGIYVRNGKKFVVK